MFSVTTSVVEDPNIKHRTKRCPCCCCLGCFQCYCLLPGCNCLPTHNVRTDQFIDIRPECNCIETRFFRCTAGCCGGCLCVFGCLCAILCCCCHRLDQQPHETQYQRVVEILSGGKLGEFPVLGFGAHMLRAFLVFDNLLLFAASLAVLVGVTYYAQVFSLVQTWFVPCVALGVFVMVLSLIGLMGVCGNVRCLLFAYVLINFLVGLALLVVSSYALTHNNDGATFVADAWTNSPDNVRKGLQVTFSCCGLQTFADAYAVEPCPVNSSTRCMDPLLAEFNRYSTQVPVLGLIVWGVLWVVACMTLQLAYLIKHARHVHLPEEY